MRDEETGTYWQQISGAAVSGPLAGRRLEFVSSDELTFALWKAEQPGGTVLDDLPRDISDYAPNDWDIAMKKVPTVLSYSEPGLGNRDLMLGVEAFGAARAFPYEKILQEKLVQDHVGPEPVLLVVAPDNASVRVFRRRISGVKDPPEFYRLLDAEPGPPGALFMDSATGSKWNFQGCALSGPAGGECLEHVDVIKDYWFDWRHYHPLTTVFGKRTP